MSQHPLYNTWKKMRDRCNNPNAHNYANYGGRGIKICKRWNSFEQFAKDLGVKPSPNHTLDRIDSDGDYTPKNCRWATKTEQNRNKKRVLIFNGETVPQIAKKYGVDRSRLRKKLREGHALEEVLKKISDKILTETKKAA